MQGLVEHDIISLLHSFGAGYAAPLDGRRAPVQGSGAGAEEPHGSWLGARLPVGLLPEDLGGPGGRLPHLCHQTRTQGNYRVQLPYLIFQETEVCVCINVEFTVIACLLCVNIRVCVCVYQGCNPSVMVVVLLFCGLRTG